MCERGYLHQATDFLELDKLMASQKITAYVGFDATAPSLHVGALTIFYLFFTIMPIINSNLHISGSMVQIMILRLLQKCGHTPVVLIGGGTTRIGDPSGKDTSRRMLTVEEINSNATSLHNFFRRVLKFDSGSNPPQFVSFALLEITLEQN
jgi:tyrosyl-tRNA synthetase